ncbi:methyltransferase domain-containing protein [Streptomyces sp. NPDC004111]|uniref:methyltransferase domain-containing protein n=1 Tax=Streptomyces sp. NPDC004111 TaxID=3364690 RepID=UPI0036ACE3F2
MDDAELRQRCEQVIDTYKGGYFHDRAWLREAFRAVPRHHFVPDRVWAPERGEDGRYPVLDRARDPAGWLEAVYRPGWALITQIADGAVRVEDGPTPSNDFTSSISSTAAVINMLHHFDPRPGERVLEIGTGTGYSTALTAHRVGDRNLVTMEVQQDLAERAEARLAALGYRLRILCGDGEEGWQEGAPYDRLISTAGVREIPAAWLRQVRAGGVIVTPIATPMRCDALAWLKSDGQGGGEGRLVTALYFMKVRGQRESRPWRETGWPTWPQWSLTVTPDQGQTLRTR